MTIARVAVFVLLNVLGKKGNKAIVMVEEGK